MTRGTVKRVAGWDLEMSCQTSGREHELHIKLRLAKTKRPTLTEVLPTQDPARAPADLACQGLKTCNVGGAV